MEDPSWKKSIENYKKLVKIEGKKIGSSSDDVVIFWKKN